LAASGHELVGALVRAREPVEAAVVGEDPPPLVELLRVEVAEVAGLDLPDRLDVFPVAHLALRFVIDAEPIIVCAAPPVRCQAPSRERAGNVTPSQPRAAVRDGCWGRATCPLGTNRCQAP